MTVKVVPPVESSQEQDDRLLDVVIKIEGLREFIRTYYDEVDIDRNALRGATTPELYGRLRGMCLSLRREGDGLVIIRREGTLTCSLDGNILPVEHPVELQLGTHSLEVGDLELVVSVDPKGA